MKRRSATTVFILSIVSLGIYTLYWLNQTKEALNDTTASRTPVIWWLVAPYLAMPICLILIFTAISTTSAQNLTLHFNGSACSSSTGGSCSSSSTTSVGHPALLLFGMALAILALLYALSVNLYWYYSYSKGVTEFTAGKRKSTSTILLLLLIPPVGAGIIQSAFNNILDHGMSQNRPVVSSPPQTPGGPPEPTVSSV